MPFKEPPWTPALCSCPGLVALFPAAPPADSWYTFFTPWLPLVRTGVWGGLLLTLMLTIVGNIGALPLGILLALGRRSHLPIVRYFSIGYIELIRGVPPFTILFMANLLVPLLFLVRCTPS